MTWLFKRSLVVTVLDAEVPLCGDLSACTGQTMSKSKYQSAIGSRLHVINFSEFHVKRKQAKENCEEKEPRIGIRAVAAGSGCI